MSQKENIIKGTITAFILWFRHRVRSKMLPRTEWMNTASVPILELMEEVGAPIPQATIIVVFDRRGGPSHATISRALGPLERYGLIMSHPQYSSLWELTELGHAYLDGDLDPSKLEAKD